MEATLKKFGIKPMIGFKRAFSSLQSTLQSLPKNEQIVAGGWCQKIVRPSGGPAYRGFVVVTNRRVFVAYQNDAIVLKVDVCDQAPVNEIQSLELGRDGLASWAVLIAALDWAWRCRLATEPEARSLYAALSRVQARINTDIESGIVREGTSEALRLSSDSLAEELLKLAQMKGQGILSEAEFDSAKKRLLG